jgi:hypothetical protein
MITNNSGLTRICLAVFTLLGLVAIPTYFSGTGSWDLLSGNSKISDDLMDYHYGWGVTALAVLMVTGAVAFIELLRSSRFGKFSNNALHLVLGLAIVSLGLMAVVGEMGWELNHHELPLATEKTPQIWSHVHIILNHFPSVGFVFALVTLLLMAETGHRGGQINHPEIRLATDVLPTDPRPCPASSRMTSELEGV